LVGRGEDMVVTITGTRPGCRFIKSIPFIYCCLLEAYIMSSPPSIQRLSPYVKVVKVTSAVVYDPSHFCPSWVLCCEQNLALHRDKQGVGVDDTRFIDQGFCERQQH
jgi:hypothetical protein